MEAGGADSCAAATYLEKTVEGSKRSSVVDGIGAGRQRMKAVKYNVNTERGIEMPDLDAV
jgi:hypothetical protein